MRWFTGEGDKKQNLQLSGVSSLGLACFELVFSLKSIKPTKWYGGWPVALIWEKRKVIEMEMKGFRYTAVTYTWRYWTMRELLHEAIPGCRRSELTDCQLALEILGTFRSFCVCEIPVKEYLMFLKLP